MTTLLLVKYGPVNAHQRTDDSVDEVLADLQFAKQNNTMLECQRPNGKVAHFNPWAVLEVFEA